MDPEYCLHPRCREERRADELVCGWCGAVLATGLKTKRRTPAERDADEEESRRFK
jgi:transcription initiation factor TFIIIB Brf1 subunit/transcription initiation factor TFIIB